MLKCRIDVVLTHVVLQLRASIHTYHLSYDLSQDSFSIIAITNV